jgi:prepilin-type N-terminal cleavage/methylation domain-containing protein
MNKISVSQKKGFTLLEILLVIAAIGILASIVLVAINPNRQLSQARNAQRRSDVNAISGAIYQKIIDEANAGTTNTLTAITTTVNEIYKSGTTTGTTNCTGTPIDMAAMASDAGADVVPTYLAAIPQDPSEGSTSVCSGYTVVKDANNRITVAAPNAELSTTISVTR